MAGSLSIRRYTTDDGTDYAIRIDESNASGNVIGSSSELVPPREANYPPIPRSLKPRYVIAYNETNPVQKRKFTLGGVASISQVFQPGSKIRTEGVRIDDETTVRDLTWVITSYRGEKVDFLAAFTSPDTGLIDGDTAQ
jgi:hypothetical protein